MPTINARARNQNASTDLLSDMNTQPQTHDFADMTLDELGIALAPDIAASAIFDGWNKTALMAAAEMAGCDPDIARLAFPGKGVGGLAMELIAAWIASVDQAMEAEWPAERLATLKIRERIRTLVAFPAGRGGRRGRGGAPCACGDGAAAERGHVAQARLAFGRYHVAALR